MSKLLLVEDSKEIYVMVNQAIGSLYDLKWVQTIEEAKVLLNTNGFILILLDIELPDGNGVEFCSKLTAENPNQAIFLLTSHNDLSEKVLGFSAGADDYITKPFQTLELKARVEAKVNKISSQSKLTAISKWKALEIDKNRQSVRVLEEEKFVDIDLTHIEFKLLTYMADRAENVIPRDEILNEIWGKDVYVYSRSVDTHVSKLRKKLGSASTYIKSIHGTGYKFSEPTAKN